MGHTVEMLAFTYLTKVDQLNTDFQRKSHHRCTVSAQPPSSFSLASDFIPMSFYEAETLLSVDFSDCYFLFVVFVFFFISLNLEVALLFRRFLID